jgi:hypothetical protein
MNDIFEISKPTFQFILGDILKIIGDATSRDKVSVVIHSELRQIDRNETYNFIYYYNFLKPNILNNF